jgi:hypothetical protein
MTRLVAKLPGAPLRTNVQVGRGAVRIAPALSVRAKRLRHVEAFEESDILVASAPRPLATFAYESPTAEHANEFPAIDT